MKSVIKLLLLSIFSTIFFIACQEDFFIDEQELEDPLSRSLCTVTNSLNPMDSVGIMHNYLLGLIEDEASITEDSYEDFNEVSDSILIAQYDSSVVSLLVDTMYARHIFLAICDDSTLVTSYIDTLDITDPAKNKLEELFAIISLYDESNLCTIVDSIKTYESTLASAGLSVTELTIIRSASSVARHSIDYWDGRITAEGVQSRIKICIRIRIRFKTVAIVFADVAGTVKGGLDGGPTLAGMFASGVVSAVSTSGNAAKLFDGL